MLPTIIGPYRHALAVAIVLFTVTASAEEAAQSIPLSGGQSNFGGSISDRIFACKRPPLVFRVNPRILPSNRSELCHLWHTPPVEYKPYFFSMLRWKI